MKKDECHHENVKQLSFIRKEYPFGPRVPSSELWRVRCLDCGEVFEDWFIGD